MLEYDIALQIESSNYAGFTDTMLSIQSKFQKKLHIMIPPTSYTGLAFFFFFFLISYFTWVFIQVLSPVLPWSPGPECTEQFDCRDGFSLLICSERHISNGR